jgi:hypothetical protein
MRFTAMAFVVLLQNRNGMQAVAQLEVLLTTDGVWLALVHTAMLFSRQFWNVTV